VSKILLNTLKIWNHNHNEWEIETLRLFGYLNLCDLCQDEFPIHKYDPYYEVENQVWIEYNGKQYLCNDCRENNLNYE